MVLIEDGTGGGYLSKIDSHNRLRTYSVIENEASYIAEEHQQAYNWIINVTPAGAGDVFGYMKNTFKNVLVISEIKIYVATNESIQIKFDDVGTPVGGSTSTPTNMYAKSGNTADGIFQTGTNITGLSGGYVVEHLFIDGGTNMQSYTWCSGLLLPKNGIATFYAITGGIAINMSICFHYHI